MTDFVSVHQCDIDIDYRLTMSHYLRNVVIDEANNRIIDSDCMAAEFTTVTIKIKIPQKHIKHVIKLKRTKQFVIVKKQQKTHSVIYSYFRKCC